MTRWRVASALIWLPVVCAQSSAVRIEIYSLAPSVIQSRLELVTRKIIDRRARLESLFREVGCDAEYLTEQSIPHLKDPNVVCVLPGISSTMIVVGGHYDLADRGMGAVDDWSGAVMLPSVYQSLKSKARRDTFVFVAFAGEEGGLLGSHAYIKQLSAEERRLIYAMVNLECLGASPPKVWASRADKRLLALYSHLAPSVGIKAEASNVERIGDDDRHFGFNEICKGFVVHRRMRIGAGFWLPPRLAWIPRPWRCLVCQPLPPVLQQSFHYRK
jgi:Peptidase family M28